MGETDLSALRFLLAAQEKSRPVSPKDLAQYLSISSASTTTLIDRLVKSGHVERLRHPSDGRAVVLNITAMSDDEVRSTMSEMHRRMIEVTSELSSEDALVITAFLTKMTRAIDQIDEHALKESSARTE
jgi:DNA-binding MarR family transcriptional regulator